MPYNQNAKTINHRSAIQHDKLKMLNSLNSLNSLTVGDIVSGHFWYNEQLTWEVIGFDEKLVELRCLEFDIPIQTTHNSTLIRV